MASTGVLGFVINELSYWQKRCLVIIYKIDKSLKIGFYYAILSLGLAICLKIKGG